LGNGSTIDVRQRFGLMWAVGLSILLHLLLVLLTVWFPITRSAAVAVVNEPDDTITFTFARDVEPTTNDLRQDSRFTPLEPRPNPEAATLPIPDRPDVPPVEVTDPQPADAPADPPPEPFEELEPAETVESPTAELPERPEGLFRQPPRQRETSPPRDMQQALRDFGRALANRPPPEPPSQPSENAEQNVIVPELSSIPASGFGMGNLVFESRDYDWNDYGRQVYMAIWRAWHNRLWMTTDDFEKWAYRNQRWRLEEDSTQVRFVIESNGQVTGIVQEEGSACEPLDASALDALAEVILPPLPPDFPRDREVVHARFIAKGPIRAMRPVLGRYKAMGLF
jgi:hypothetical protein